MTAALMTMKKMKMNSTMIRDLMPGVGGGEDLPEVVMPVCEARPILKGQTAIVTGASSGIGRGIANALCAAGANVIINYVGPDAQAEEVVHEATHCGCSHRGKAVCVKADVSDEAQVEGMFSRAFTSPGRTTPCPGCIR